MHKNLIGWLLGLALIQSVPGRTDTVVILHTNDIHAHLRADYDGSGGLSFVSGTIARQRSQRPDILVLDAGDVAEKGDLVAFATDCEIVYEAMGRIGYDAGAPGNHDHDFGLPQLKRFAELAAPMQMLCINLVDEAGAPAFAPSTVFDVDGVRVGVIGMIVPRKELCLDDEETAAAMAREAERLEPDVDLTVALCHDSVEACETLSRAAPLIDVFVSGHSHETLAQAVVVPETGARIVQAGCYAEYVGRIELTIDLDSGAIVAADSELITMDHNTTPCDIGMQEWVRQSELDLAPEAARLVGWTDREIGYRQMGDLGARAIQWKTGAEVAFCGPGQVIRATLPVGLIDLNAIFRTGGERGHHLVEAQLLGTEIEAYLQGLAISDWYQTSWSGFKASIEKTGDEVVIRTDLTGDQSYRVVLPQLEWTTRFLRLVDRARSNPEAWPLDLPETAPETWPVDTTFTEATADFLSSPAYSGLSLTEIIDLSLTDATGLPETTRRRSLYQQ